MGIFNRGGGTSGETPQTGGKVRGTGGNATGKGVGVVTKTFDEIGLKHHEVKWKNGSTTTHRSTELTATDLDW
jgi:hypothetical protein